MKSVGNTHGVYKEEISKRTGELSDVLLKSHEGDKTPNQNRYDAAQDGERARSVVRDSVFDQCF